MSGQTNAAGAMRVMVAALIAVSLALGMFIAHEYAEWRARRKSVKSGFFTESARAEPTREWAAYTGTVPVGYWGPRPWAHEVSTRCGMDGRQAGASMHEVEQALVGACDWRTGSMRERASEVPPVRIP